MSRIRFLHFIRPSFLWNEVINLSLPTLGIVKRQGFCIDLTAFLVTIINRGRRLFLLFLDLYVLLRINFNDILYKYSNIRIITIIF